MDKGKAPADADPSVKPRIRLSLTSKSAQSVEKAIVDMAEAARQHEGVSRISGPIRLRTETITVAKPSPDNEDASFKVRVHKRLIVLYSASEIDDDVLNDIISPYIVPGVKADAEIHVQLLVVPIISMNKVHKRQSQPFTMKLLFCGTFWRPADSTKRTRFMDMIKFEEPVIIDAWRVVMPGLKPHRAVDFIGQTYPLPNRLDFYIHPVRSNEAVYTHVGTYYGAGEELCFPLLKVVRACCCIAHCRQVPADHPVDQCVIRGDYAVLSICIYGYVAESDSFVDDEEVEEKRIFPSSQSPTVEAQFLTPIEVDGLPAAQMQTLLPQYLALDPRKHDLSGVFYLPSLNTLVTAEADTVVDEILSSDVNTLQKLASHLSKYTVKLRKVTLPPLAATLVLQGLDGDGMYNSMLIISTIAANDVRFAHDVIDGGAIQRLMTIASTCSTSHMKIKALFALSCLCEYSKGASVFSESLIATLMDMFKGPALVQLTAAHLLRRVMLSIIASNMTKLAMDQTNDTTCLTDMSAMLSELARARHPLIQGSGLPMAVTRLLIEHETAASLAVVISKAMNTNDHDTVHKACIIIVVLLGSREGTLYLASDTSATSLIMQALQGADGPGGDLPLPALLKRRDWVTPSRTAHVLYAHVKAVYVVDDLLEPDIDTDYRLSSLYLLHSLMSTPAGRHAACWAMSTDEGTSQLLTGLAGVDSENTDSPMVTVCGYISALLLSSLVTAPHWDGLNITSLHIGIIEAANAAIASAGDDLHEPCALLLEWMKPITIWDKKGANGVTEHLQSMISKKDIIKSRPTIHFILSILDGRSKLSFISCGILHTLAEVLRLVSNHVRPSSIGRVAWVGDDQDELVSVEEISLLVETIALIRALLESLKNAGLMDYNAGMILTPLLDCHVVLSAPRIVGNTDGTDQEQAAECGMWSLGVSPIAAMGKRDITALIALWTSPPWTSVLSDVLRFCVKMPINSYSTLLLLERLLTHADGTHWIGLIAQCEPLVYQLIDENALTSSKSLRASLVHIIQLLCDLGHDTAATVFKPLTDQLQMKMGNSELCKVTRVIRDVVVASAGAKAICLTNTGRFTTLLSKPMDLNTTIRVDIVLILQALCDAQISFKYTDGAHDDDWMPAMEDVKAICQILLGMLATKELMNAEIMVCLIALLAVARQRTLCPILSYMARDGNDLNAVLHRKGVSEEMVKIVVKILSAVTHLASLGHASMLVNWQNLRDSVSNLSDEATTSRILALAAMAENDEDSPPIELVPLASHRPIAEIFENRVDAPLTPMRTDLDEELSMMSLKELSLLEQPTVTLPHLVHPPRTKDDRRSRHVSSSERNEKSSRR